VKSSGGHGNVGRVGCEKYWSGPCTNLLEEVVPQVLSQISALKNIINLLARARAAPILLAPYCMKYLTSEAVLWLGKRPWLRSPPLRLIPHLCLMKSQRPTLLRQWSPYGLTHVFSSSCVIRPLNDMRREGHNFCFRFFASFGSGCIESGANNAFWCFCLRVGMACDMSVFPNQSKPRLNRDGREKSDNSIYQDREMASLFNFSRWIMSLVAVSRISHSTVYNATSCGIALVRSVSDPSRRLSRIWGRRFDTSLGSLPRGHSSRTFPVRESDHPMR
jgi:hypothetical protein